MICKGCGLLINRLWTETTGDYCLFCVDGEKTEKIQQLPVRINPLEFKKEPHTPILELQKNEPPPVEENPPQIFQKEKEELEQLHDQASGELLTLEPNLQVLLFYFHKLVNHMQLIVKECPNWAARNNHALRHLRECFESAKENIVTVQSIIDELKTTHKPQTTADEFRQMLKDKAIIMANIKSVYFGVEDAYKFLTNLPEANKLKTSSQEVFDETN